MYIGSFRHTVLNPLFFGPVQSERSLVKKDVGKGSTERFDGRKVHGHVHGHETGRSKRT